MAKRSKLNPRQEKFVREYVKTGNGRQAYQKAGYQSSVEEVNGAASVDVNASRLLRSDQVKNAIALHQARVRTRHDYTIDTLLFELEDGRQLAHATAQPSAAVSATIGKARLLGMIVDRKEVGAPGDFAGLDTAQAILALIKKELGDRAADALAALIQEPLTIEATPVNTTTLPDATIDQEND